jgi:signal transduction histidine kinase
MPNQTPLTPELLVPRLGDYLVEKGNITSEQLQLALNAQAEARKKQTEIPLLGQVLVEMGFLERPTVEHAITELIIQLRTALQDANEQLELRVQERTADLEKAIRKLSELNQLKANFVSNVSHELRSPIAHIKGYLELFVNDELGPLSDDQLKAMRVMVRSADRLGSLIEDLILFSMSESEPLTLRLQPFCLTDLCESIMKEAQFKASDDGVVLIKKFDPDLPMVQGDDQKLSWVISQLLDNAIKFTHAGGRVSLDLKLEDKFIRVAVIDSGIGIPGDKMEEIFEPFHQLDSSSSRRYGGTGLGLALVRKIVEAHGSSIHVTSQLGKGSRFEFLLNVAGDS